MNTAFVAVLITIGVIVALGIIGLIVEIIDWDTVSTWGRFILFLILPTPLMIIGVAGNQGLMIFAEVLTCIGSWSMTQNRDASSTWIAFVPLLPTIICLIACIATNIVAAAVILVIVGFLQVGAAIGAYS